ncbi:hypothetical protein GCM10009555_025240 [Acrocarpospora macrocephala]|uniref:Integral membrane protein n=1 Tax=Acrocarpospora macrocephala TaxID=150177 RepID=A0A5M3WP78_9ACTN|nr:hypothetical protein [Acrocarpospora macrocephala]GES10346.1 hypothetical protein Amac_039430 [Acrocarpospora macrocephala]
MTPAERDDALTASIMRRQLREALRTLAVVAGVFAALPALLAVLPRGSAATWVILGAGVPPIWVAVAWWHVRRAERAEAREREG